MKPVLLAAVTTTADYMARWNVYPSDDADAWITQAVKTVGYYERTMWEMSNDLYDGNKTSDEFIVAFLLLLASQLRRAWNEGMREAGLSPADMTPEMEDELQAAVNAETEHVNDLATDIRNAVLAGVLLATLRWRIGLWAHRYVDVRNRAVIAAGKVSGGMYVWNIGATEQHCIDCSSYNGQKKTAREWDAIYKFMGHRPQSFSLSCKGFNCDCELRRVK